MTTDSATWWVYIVQTRKGKLYTGISTDVDRRFSQHSTGKGGARFFRSDPPQAVVYREQQADRSAASRREAEIKKMTRQEKLSLLT